MDGADHRVRGPGSGLISRNTSPFNAIGLPAITVPCGVTQAGLPIGVQFITSPFEEGLLFQVADSYEQVSPSQGLSPAVTVGTDVSNPCVAVPAIVIAAELVLLGAVRLGHRRATPRSAG